MKLQGNPNLQNNKGQTPLMISTKWRNLDMFNCLLDYIDEKDINIQDNNGNTISHYVCQANIREFLLCLCSLKDIMTIRNKYGLLPFDICSQQETHQIFSKFFQYKPNLNYGSRFFRKGKLIKKTHFDRIRNCLLKKNDYQERKKKSLNFEFKVKRMKELMSTASSSKDMKRLKKKCQIIQDQPKKTFKSRIPDEFNKQDFEIEFEHLTNYLKHCNEFKSFEFENLLGVGGFGEVWRVFNKKTQKRLAVKIINIDSKVKPRVLKRLAKIERDIMSQIDFPFICKCLYSFKSEKRFYLFMEYCPYKDLGHLGRVVFKGFNERAVKFFLAEMVLALGYLQSKNIMHRDIKPENVLMDRTGHIKLTGSWEILQTSLQYIIIIY